MPPPKNPPRRPGLGELLAGASNIAARGSRIGLVVVLRAAEVNRVVLEKVAKEMAEAEEAEWTKLKPPERHTWVLRAASSIRALSTHFEG